MTPAVEVGRPPRREQPAGPVVDLLDRLGQGPALRLWLWHARSMARRSTARASPTSMPRADVWEVVRAERLALADDLWPLSDARWATPSLSPGWDVHDVVAHLAHDARTTRRSFACDILRARLDFDHANAAGVRRARRRDPRRTLVALEWAGGRTTSAPAPLATRLVEMIVHGEDIRRPLGLDRSYPLDAVVAALAYQARTGVALGGGRERAEGLTLLADDAALRRGTGPEVRGSALALLLALSGRPVRPGELTGPGAAALTR